MLVGLAVGAPVAVCEAEEPTAEQFADQAYKRYEKGEFPDAIALYMKSYELSRDARLLFNVAQIYDKKIQDRELAIEYYRRYLKTTTTEAELVKRSTERIAALSAAAADKPTPPAASASATPPAQSQKAPVAPPPPSPPAEPRSSPPLWIGWTTAGVFAAGALVTGIVALGKAQDAKDTAFVGRASGPADDKASSAKTMALVSTLLTGGAVLAGGITIYLSTTSKTSTALNIGPGSLLLKGAF